MNIKYLRDEFERQLVDMGLITPKVVRFYRDGNYYTKDYVNDAWEDFKKEKNQTKKV